MDLKDFLGKAEGYLPQIQAEVCRNYVPAGQTCMPTDQVVKKPETIQEFLSTFFSDKRNLGMVAVSSLVVGGLVYGLQKKSCKR